MDFEAVARRLRGVPWLTWLLLVLGVLYLVRRVLPPVSSPVGALADAGPIFFAAAVIYMNPPYRRFRWAAVALAIPAIVGLLANSIPIIWEENAPGDWVNAVPLLWELGTWAVDIATLIGLVGLFLLGLALGGVRSFMSVLILGLGALVALADLTWFFTHPVEELPLFQLVKSTAYPIFHVLGWAFVFAAALESLRNLMLVGTGLVFASAVINGLLLWWAIGPGANLDLLSLLIVVPLLVGWLAMTAGALRGELSEARIQPRDRRQRRASSRSATR